MPTSCTRSNCYLPPFLFFFSFLPPRRTQARNVVHERQQHQLLQHISGFYPALPHPPPVDFHDGPPPPPPPTFQNSCVRPWMVVLLVVLRPYGNAWEQALRLDVRVSYRICSAADPGGGHSGHVPPPPPPPFINKFITFRAAFYNIAARLRCLLISARMNSTTVLYPGPPDTRSYFPPPRPSYRARNQQHPPPPPPPALRFGPESDSTPP